MTNEEVVTRILSNHEILERDDVDKMFEEGSKTYVTIPEYDLTHYLNTKAVQKRFDDKYLFVT